MSTDSFVKSFTHLKDRPKADRALTMLQRIASLVKPIMRKHNWVLPVLSEFFPEQPNLLGLNVNGGQKILVRLRPPHAPDTFLEEEQVVQTMLHELTHNVHGPHDEKFYKYLSGLQDEYDTLQRSGYAGEGFFSKGQRLGENVSHDLPSHLARLKALEAAEKRRKTSVMLGSGGRLGGRINPKGLTSRELAAQAAERRVRDEKACGSGEVAQREAEKAEKESVEHKVIDLTADSDDEQDSEVSIMYKTMPVAGSSKLSGPQTKKMPSSTTPSSTNSRPVRPPLYSQSTDVKNGQASRDRSAPYPKPEKRALLVSRTGEWSCPACTLLNPALALQCDACLSQRPPDETTGWTCLTCGESGMPHDFWSCQFCGAIKVQS